MLLIQPIILNIAIATDPVYTKVYVLMWGFLFFTKTFSKRR